MDYSEINIPKSEKIYHRDPSVSRYLLFYELDLCKR